MASRFRLLPGTGISHSTHATDLDERIKRNVAEALVNAEWQHYVRPPKQSAGKFLTKLGFDPRYGAAEIFRGTEAALLALLAQKRPRKLWAPILSYPGFRRVCAISGTELHRYSRSADLESANASDVIVTVSPGSPVEVIPAQETLRISNSIGATAVLDISLSMLTAERIHRLEELASTHSAILLISASKGLGLAGARLGFTRVPVGASPPTSALEWDIFQCALIEALCSGDTLKRRADEVSKKQTQWNKSIRRLALQAGWELVPNPGNELSVTVRKSSMNRTELGYDGWKIYEGHDLVRLDASPSMISRLERMIEVGE